MNKRILVVDDQAGILALVEEVLTDVGYWVDTASDLAEFEEKLHHEGFDLYIVDLLLPGVNGVDLFKKACQCVSPGRIIVMSGFDCPKTKQDIQKLGITKYIEKPFDLTELIQKVEESLEQISA